jgi:uncharacterized protein YbcI
MASLHCPFGRDEKTVPHPGPVSPTEYGIAYSAEGSTVIGRTRAISRIINTGNVFILFILTP